MFSPKSSQDVFLKYSYVLFKQENRTKLDDLGPYGAFPKKEIYAHRKNQTSEKYTLHRIRKNSSVFLFK